MLHILNKAWLDILIHQAIQNPKLNFLIVAADAQERSDIILYIRSHVPKSFSGNLSVRTIDTVQTERSYLSFCREEFPIFDNIIVTSELHDVFLKSFLSKHCKHGRQLSY